MKLIDYNEVLKMVSDWFKGCEPTEDRDYLAREFIEDLAQIPAIEEQSWIPVDSGNLPPVGKKVLTCGVNNAINIAYIRFYTPTGNPFWKKNDTGKAYNPVAWMYLPKPYSNV